MSSQLEKVLTKADSEQLARSLAEEQYADLEKQKTILELEIKAIKAKHNGELSTKIAAITEVFFTGVVIRLSLISLVML